MVRTTGRTITAVAVVICTYLSIVSVAYAADANPDTFTIQSSAVATGLIEDNDYLFLAQYDCSWALEANYPDDPINEKVILQLRDASGSSTYAAVKPYVFFNGGYDKGICSLYFSAVDSIAFNLSWESQYRLRLLSIPGAFTSISEYEYIIPSNEYCNSGSASQSANRSWVAEYCLNTAKTLELNWEYPSSLTTMSINEVLSEYGEAYYARAIPGLKRLCPQLFMAVDTVPEFTETVYTGSHASDLQNQWTGQDNIVTDAQEGFGEFMGNNQTFAMNFVTVGIALALIILSGAGFKSVLPGMLVSVAILMPVMVDLGFFEIALMGIILFLIILYSVNKTLQLNRA